MNLRDSNIDSCFKLFEMKQNRINSQKKEIKEIIIHHYLLSRQARSYKPGQSFFKSNQTEL